MRLGSSIIDNRSLAALRSASHSTFSLAFLAMTQKLLLIDNMRQFGGNFVSKLADAMAAADPDNYKKLVEAFPEIVEKYSNWGA